METVAEDRERHAQSEAWSSQASLEELLTARQWKGLNALSEMSWASSRFIENRLASLSV